jgi:hypothetical protein
VRDRHVSRGAFRAQRAQGGAQLCRWDVHENVFERDTGSPQRGVLDSRRERMRDWMAE